MSKNTLKNDTLNGTYPPKELAPSKETSLKGKGVTNVFRPNKTPVGLGILINYHTQYFIQAKEEYQVKQESVDISYIVQVPTMRLLLSILNDSVFVSPFEPQKGYR